MTYELKPTKILPIIIILSVVVIFVPVYLAIGIYSIVILFFSIKPIQILFSQSVIVNSGDDFSIYLNGMTIFNGELMDGCYSDNNLIILRTSTDKFISNHGFLKVRPGEIVIQKSYCSGAADLDEHLHGLPIAWRDFSLRQIPHYLW